MDTFLQYKLHLFVCFNFFKRDTKERRSLKNSKKIKSLLREVESLTNFLTVACIWFVAGSLYGNHVTLPLPRTRIMCTENFGLFKCLCGVINNVGTFYSEHWNSKLKVYQLLVSSLFQVPTFLRNRWLNPTNVPKFCSCTSFEAS